MIFKKTITILCALFIILCASSCRDRDTAVITTQAVYTSVTLLNPRENDISKEMIYAGAVSAAESVNVISRVTAKVTDVYFDVGDFVNAGDVLFKLDERDVRDQLKQIEAQINQAEQGIIQAENAVSSVTGGQFQAQVLQQETSIENYAKQLENAALMLQTANIGIDNAQTTISNAQTGVDNAASAFETTSAQFENTKALYEAGLVAQNDYDRAALGYDQASAQVSQAEAGLKQANNGLAAAQKQLEQAQVSYDTLKMAISKAEEGLNLTTTTVAEDNERAAQLAVESARASLDSLFVQKELIEAALLDTTVASPISGVISQRIAKVNEYVSNQYPPFTIVDISAVYIDVKVSEAIINSLSPGLLVDITVKAANIDAKGVIKTVAPAADQTGGFPARIEVDNKDSLIKPGMFAEVKFIKEQSAAALVLPRGAVLSDENGMYVYIENVGYAKKVYIETGIDNGFEIEIVSGVTAADSVIVKGQTFISDNEKVNVLGYAEAN